MSVNESWSIAESMAALARTLSTVDGLDPLLQTVVQTAVESVPGADYAGISQARGRKIMEPHISTDDIVDRINLAQTQAGHGPCLEAIFNTEAGVVRMDDVADETRWPAFAKLAAELGIASGLSFRLYAGNHVTGSLSLWSRQPSAFDTESEVMGELFATHAGIALRNAANDYDFGEALRNRDVIGQAKGLLVERFKITEQQAFKMLVDFSQREHVKLREVAVRLMQDAQGRPQAAIDG